MESCAQKRGLVVSVDQPCVVLNPESKKFKSQNNASKVDGNSVETEKLVSFENANVHFSSQSAINKWLSRRVTLLYNKIDKLRNYKALFFDLNEQNKRLHKQTQKLRTELHVAREKNLFLLKTIENLES